MKVTSKIHCLLLTAAMAAGCGGKDDSSKPAADEPETATNTTSATKTTLPTQTTSLSLSKSLSISPSGITLSVFPSSLSGLTLAEPSQTAKEALDPALRKENEEKRLRGEGSCLPPAFSEQDTTAEETCYEFDQDMLYGGRSNTGSSTISTYYGSTDGKDAAGKHACLVSFTRSKVATVQAKLDRAMGLVQAMICQAAKDKGDFTLPTTTGSSLDLKTSLATVMGDKFGTVETATIAYAGKTSAGHPIYVSTITSTREVGGKARTQTVILRHAKDPANDKIYSGLLTMAFRGDGEVQGDTTKKSDALMNILYSQAPNASGETEKKLELRFGMLHEDLAATAIDSATGLVNFNVGIHTTAGSDLGRYKKADGSFFTDANEAARAFNFIKAVMNETTEARQVSYWQNPGGNYSESARGLVFSVAKDSSGTLKGCGISGASINESIRMSLYNTAVTLAPESYWHPFFNNSTSGPETCTMTEEGDSGTLNSKSGSLWGKTCTASGPGGGTTVAQWLEPAVSDATDAENFAKLDTGTLVTRQCFARGSDQTYAIDTAVITETAGYELVDTSDSSQASKLVSAPTVAITVPTAAE